MLDRKTEFYMISSLLCLFCIVTGNTLLFPAVVLPAILFGKHKKKINNEMCVFSSHLLAACFMVSTAQPGWQERLAWFIVICQGWILGLKLEFEGLAFSILGKAITLIWLNYFYGFDILSPNYIPYVPILVSKIFRKKETNEENTDNEMIVTDTHGSNKNPLFSLPFIVKLEPIEKSPPVSSLFYHSNGGIYKYQSKQYRVISLINGAKVYLQVELILE